MSLALPTRRQDLQPLLTAQWLSPDLQARSAADWQRRLAIVVPYRDREAHLQLFVPYLHDYFRHDKLDRQIPWTLHIVEQADDLPFNRGQLANAAFRLVGDTADYLCIHDVDLLPLWADYAYPAQPARLCLHGTQVAEQAYAYFGGVTAITMDDFGHCNGFSNGYWGWGLEDIDLRLRLLLSGLRVEARDGRYNALRHAHNGMATDGRLTPAAQRNLDRFDHELAGGFTHWRQDGLNSLRCEHLGSSALLLGGTEWPAVRHHRIRLQR